MSGLFLYGFTANPNIPRGVVTHTAGCVPERAMGANLMDNSKPKLGQGHLQR